MTFYMLKEIDTYTNNTEVFLLESSASKKVIGSLIEECDKENGYITLEMFIEYINSKGVDGKIINT
ncbi:MAG: hypothetical protein PHH36_14070, partial [Sideroxydans sp.]|nr:hypothetical protein [Sideroxydans sp.]